MCLPFCMHPQVVLHPHTVSALGSPKPPAHSQGPQGGLSADMGHRWGRCGGGGCMQWGAVCDGACLGGCTGGTKVVHAVRMKVGAMCVRVRVSWCDD